MVTRVLQLRNKYAGALLAAVRSINALDIKSEDDFGEGLHSAHTEPYFYGSAYKYKDGIPKVLAQDELGACRHVDNPPAGKDKDCTPKAWKCSEKCKPLSESEVSSILNFKSDFEGSMPEVLLILCSLKYTALNEFVGMEIVSLGAFRTS